MAHTWYGLDPSDVLLPACALALWLVALALYGLSVVMVAARGRRPL